jgi:hypothetical protein
MWPSLSHTAFLYQLPQPFKVTLSDDDDDNNNDDDNDDNTITLILCSGRPDEESMKATVTISSRPRLSCCDERRTRYVTHDDTKIRKNDGHVKSSMPATYN